MQTQSHTLVDSYVQFLKQKSWVESKLVPREDLWLRTMELACQVLKRMVVNTHMGMYGHLVADVTPETFSPRLRTLHPVCRPQPIQPSNGRFYSPQPPPPGPATPGGSLAARGRPQCRSGPRAPAHPGGGGGGAQEQV